MSCAVMSCAVASHCAASSSARAGRSSSSGGSGSSSSTRAAPPHPRRRGSMQRMQVMRKSPEPGELSKEEAEYQALMKQTKAWMAYDPDAVPEHDLAPWEVHLNDLIDNGPWPCWDPSKPESDYEPEPEWVSFKEAPGVYNMFDDKAKQYHIKLAAERAKLTEIRQKQIYSQKWMQMDDDVRLKKIPSCVEAGWTHEKIMELINYPDDVKAKMEEHSVFVYDPRFPCDSTWIHLPEPDTVEFLRDIGHLVDEDEDDIANAERLAKSLGIVQRFEGAEDGADYLNQTSEVKLSRAIDIGDDEEDDEGGFSGGGGGGRGSRGDDGDNDNRRGDSDSD